MAEKKRIILSKPQKIALQQLFRTFCRHQRSSYDGKTVICGLKEIKERCEYSNWTTWSDCPTDCPHHLMKTKVTCTPDKCALADHFIKQIKECLT